MGDARTRLGAALDARTDEIAAAVIARVWPGGTDAVDAACVEAIESVDRAGTGLIAEWLTGGTHIDERQRQALGALGDLADRVGLGDLTKSYLAWRDVLLAVVDDEARRGGLPAELVAEVRAVVARNTDGSMVRMARRFDTERRRLSEQLDAERAKLSEQATHDALTGLPNRVLLFDRLEHALHVAARSTRPLALLFADLDGFKRVNDRLGHVAGDELLVEVAARLSVAVRRGDTVARLGGDEFVVLCEDLDSPGRPRHIAERMIATVGQPITVGGEPVSVSASVGIAHSDGSGTASELIVRADAAMYAAKQRGPGGLELAAPA